MLYEGRLNALGEEFAARRLAPVIVKGQAIIDLAYPSDEVRLSSDVDLLTGSDEGLVADILRTLGYREQASRSRHYRFAERGFHRQGTDLPTYVEVHRGLDKIILRPIPYLDILARARPSGRAGFRYPTVEDLLLLVVLHASADIYFDPERVRRDLAYLIDHAKPDLDLVRARAREWELSRALHRLLTDRYPKKTPRTSGRRSAAAIASYFMGQFFWHDRVVTVLRGLGQYSLARIKDRLVG
jgi:hypothetical protein